MRKIYLASRYSRHPEMQEYAKALAGLGGHAITSRWIWGNHQIPEGTLEGEHLVQSVRFAIEDYEDVCAADTVIVFTDPPRTTTRGGKHVEVGIALGRNIEIFMVGKDMENIFYYLPQIKKVDSFEILLEILKREPALVGQSNKS